MVVISNIATAFRCFMVFLQAIGPLFPLFGGGGQQASSLVAKQAVEFPQVLASDIILHTPYSNIHIICFKRTS